MTLEEQGNSIAHLTTENLSGAGYQVQRPNPDSLRWVVTRGDRDCGGFVWLADWVFVLGMADASAEDVAFARLTVEAAIGMVVSGEVK